LLLGEKIGKRLRGGETIELVSDLGGGKTSIVKGIVKGAGSADVVSSPSFTISNEYIANDIVIRHFDFYRLHEAGIIRDEISDLIQDDRTVMIVEWGEIVADVLPEAKLHIVISATGESSRKFVFSCPEKLSYLLQ
jgi:tRNA threonylcarbamoyladenosine biosynthesis protein TsaE